MIFELLHPVGEVFHAAHHFALENSHTICIAPQTSCVSASNLEMARLIATLRLDRVIETEPDRLRKGRRIIRRLRGAQANKITEACPTAMTSECPDWRRQLRSTP